MTTILNLDDIQGNVTRAYGRYAFPFARYFFLNIADTDAGRSFVEAVRPRVTTAHRWTPATRPKVTLNIGFSFPGLEMLGLPTRMLQGMPEEYVDGMKARAFILGDRDNTVTAEDSGAWCRHWDPIWRTNRQGGADDVHIWLSMNAQLDEVGTDRPVPELEEQTDWLRRICGGLGQRVRIIATNGQGGDQEYQAASAVFEEMGGKKFPAPVEHFGLTDGITDPVFAGQYPPDQEKQAVIGRGKWMEKTKGWEPLATGEFILGHPDESQEIPPAAYPQNVMHNGSFMVYRKLHQNVGTWDRVLDANARVLAAQRGIDEKQARATLIAKFVGRWSDGVPLTLAPDFDRWQKLRETLGFNDPDPLKAAAAHRLFLKSVEASDFRWADDMKGIKCPGGAHIRRVNTRDYLDPLNAVDGDNPRATTQLNKRRRILRRGLPYGPSDLSSRRDDTEQGVAMMIIGASIFRQFEFVQQQWIEYGLDFHQGNNTCPLVGSHHRHRRFTIPSDPEGDTPPYIVGDLETFVETRGGEYFFIPSITALTMIALGTVDPT
jgi:deferrochelatase/peroxidase EfeB